MTYGEDQMTVHDILIKKHSPGVNPPENVLISDQASFPHEVIFDSLDANLIQKAALKSSGAACFSGLDAYA